MNQKRLLYLSYFLFLLLFIINYYFSLLLIILIIPISSVVHNIYILHCSFFFVVVICLIISSFIIKSYYLQNHHQKEEHDHGKFHHPHPLLRIRIRNPILPIRNSAEVRNPMRMTKMVVVRILLMLVMISLLHFINVPFFIILFFDYCYPWTRTSRHHEVQGCKQEVLKRRKRSHQSKQSLVVLFVLATFRRMNQKKR